MQQAMLQQRGTARRLVSSRAPRRGLTVVCSVRARWCLDIRYGFKQEATMLLQEWIRDIGQRAGLSSSNTRLSSGAIGVPESKLEMEVTFNSTAEWEAFLASIPFKEHKAWSQRMQGMVVDGSPSWQVYRVVPMEIDGSAASSSAAVSTAPSAASASSSAAAAVAAAAAAEAAAMASLASSSSVSASGLLIPPPGSVLPPMPSGLGAFVGSSVGTGVGVGSLFGGTSFGLGSGSSSGSSSGSAASVSPSVALPPLPVPAPVPAPAVPSPSYADIPPPPPLTLPDDEDVVLDWKGEPMRINPKDKLPFKFK